MSTIRQVTVFNNLHNYLILTAVLFSFTCLLSCIKLENPYTISEAGITIENGSISNNDTLLVNNKYEIVLGVELREFLDKMVLKSPDNDPNLWVDTSVYMNDIESSIITFYVRYSTSGQKEVRIECHYEDGRMKVISIYLQLMNYSDTLPPLVRIVSQPVFYSVSSNGDTIISNNDSLPLQLKIIDANSRLNTNSITINNGAFDLIETLDTLSVYAYKSFSLAGISTSQQIDISAKDIHANKCLQLYWIRKKQELF